MNELGTFFNLHLDLFHLKILLSMPSQGFQRFVIRKADFVVRRARVETKVGSRIRLTLLSRAFVVVFDIGDVLQDSLTFP